MILYFMRHAEAEDSDDDFNRALTEKGCNRSQLAGKTLKRLNFQVQYIGHNPSISAVVSSITGANLSMKKGGIARVDVLSSRPLSGELVWLLTPKIIDALED